MKRLYCWAFHQEFRIQLTSDRTVCRKCDRIDPPHLRHRLEVFARPIALGSAV